MTNYCVTLWKKKNGWKTYERQEKVKTLKGLFENNSYEVVKRIAEDNRSEWRESTRKKVSKHAVQQTTEETIMS